jgi:tetratricopeptide (TPR) repeat protein
MFCRKAIKLSKTEQIQNEETVKSYLYLAVTLFYQSQYDSAISYCYEGLKISKETSSLWGEGFANNLLCILYRRRAEYEKAIDYGLRCVKIRKLQHDTLNLAGAYQNLANIYSMVGKPIVAVDYLSKSLELFMASKDTAGLILAHGNISNLYLDVGDVENGREHAYTALHLDKKRTLNYADNILALGTIYLEFDKKYDSALIFFSEALSVYEEIGIEDGIATANENMGMTYLKLGNYSKALKFLKNAQTKYNQIGDTSQITNMILSMGKYFAEVGKYDSADIYLSEALKIAKAKKYSRIIRESLHSLFYLNKSTLKFKEALSYYEAYSLFSDSLNRELTSSRLSDMEDKYESIKKERKIELLTFEKEKIKWRETISYYIILSIILMIIVVAILIYFKRKKEIEIANQSRQILIQKKQFAEMQLETKQIKEKEMQLDLEFKSRQLSTHALHMIQKNKMLQDVKSHLEDLSTKVKSEFRPDIKKMNLLLERNMRTEKEWSLFKMYFEQVNKDFFDSLMKINPSLNANDIKHCALIKLNLNIKETASVLNLSPHTVKSARYRLKKKFGLTFEDNLSDFIRKVS